MEPRRLAGQAPVAIIGLGAFGHSLASALKERGCKILGIDRDAATVQRYASQFPVILGDATDKALLGELNLAAYPTVVIALGKHFEAGVMASVALKSLGVRQLIFQSASSRQTEILLRLGADRVIQPDVLAGSRLALELTSPDKLEEIALGSNYLVGHVKIPKAKANLRLSDLDPVRWQVTVLAIQRGEAQIVSPALQTVLLQEDLLVLLGSSEATRALRHSLAS